MRVVAATAGMIRLDGLVVCCGAPDVKRNVA